MSDDARSTAMLSSVCSKYARTMLTCERVWCATAGVTREKGFRGSVEIVQQEENNVVGSGDVCVCICVSVCVFVFVCVWGGGGGG
jgi:hypothetical protein